MSRRPRLVVRLVLAMTGVAVLVALVVGALVSPLLSGASEQAVRESVARQADLLSQLSVVALSSRRADRIAGRSDLELGTIGPDGARSGAADALSEAEVEQLLAGRDVSADGRLDGVAVVIEGRPARNGGAVVLAGDERVGTTLTNQLRRRVLLAILLGLGAAGLAAWLVARRLSRPLVEAAGAARRMAAGERGVPLPDPDTSEVSDVVDALRSLDRALANSEGRQRDFLLSVSHELRTPLTTVRGYAEALADGVIPADEVTSVGALMQAESARLERYVADLLALARLEADDFALDLVAVDVAAVVVAAAGAWRDRAGQAGVEVRVTAPGPAFVATDSDRLRQVLDVLMDNAVRVCDPGSVIMLAVVDEVDQARIEVRDSGPGLTADDTTVAFEPGVLHARYAGLRPGGHGLGLAIAHRLVLRLGGTIQASTAVEGGAAFVITLPR